MATATKKRETNDAVFNLAEFWPNFHDKDKYVLPVTADLSSWIDSPLYKRRIRTGDTLIFTKTGPNTFAVRVRSGGTEERIAGLFYDEHGDLTKAIIVGSVTAIYGPKRRLQSIYDLRTKETTWYDANADSRCKMCGKRRLP